MQCKPIALYKWTNYSFSHPLSPYELSIHNNATKKLLTNCFWNFLDTGGIGSIWPLFPQRHLCPCLCGPPAACTPCIMHHASFHHLKPMSILACFEVFLVSKQSPFFFLFTCLAKLQDLLFFSLSYMEKTGQGVPRLLGVCLVHSMVLSCHDPKNGLKRL